MQVMCEAIVGYYLFGHPMQQADKDIYQHGAMRKVG